MHRVSFFIYFVIIALAGCAQGPLTREEKVVYQQMGETRVKLTVTEYGDNKERVFISLHADEQDAVTATLPVLEREGGVLIKVENGNERHISYRIDGLEYEVDPNRIFTRQGIQETLVRTGRISNAAMAAADSLGKKILSLIPSEMKYVIALHNNTEGRLSIRSYKDDLASDASQVKSQPGADPDDFFLTTDQRLYRSLENQFNIVLQDNDRVKDDGSLSVYYGKRGIIYLNCESQHGHKAEHQRMVRAAVTALDRLTK